MTEPGGEIIMPKSDTEFRAPDAPIEPEIAAPEPRRWQRGTKPEAPKPAPSIPGIRRGGEPRPPLEPNGTNQIIQPGRVIKVGEQQSSATDSENVIVQKIER